MKRLFAMGAVIFFAPSLALAQVRGDVTELGQGARSGAVCKAVRDYDDPLVQQGARVWTLQCRGWDVSIGKVYLTDRLPVSQLATESLTRTLDCASPVSESAPPLQEGKRLTCRVVRSKAPYVIASARRGRFTVIGGSYAAAADVLLTGLAVTSGAIRPPVAAERRQSAASAEVSADFGGSDGGLAAADQAVHDNQRLVARGYVSNNEWRFDQAETDFRSLADATQNGGGSNEERAEALLNLALNISNNGRFAEAEVVFGEADAAIARTDDDVLRASALNDRALHLRNQSRFDDAVAEARGALEVRARARRIAGDNDQNVTIAPDGAIVIGSELANKLNVHANARDLMGGEAISSAKRLAIQDVEALEIIGSCQAALGNLAAADASLRQGVERLAAAEEDGVLNVRLRARLLADQGDLEMSKSNPGVAAAHYNDALKALRTRYSSTSTEAGLLFDLGNAQVEAGDTDGALASFDRGFSLFRDTRGSLGASADDASPYFALLLKLAAAHPENARLYASRFFTAAQSVVTPATAATVARLATRIASSDDETAGLIRAIDDLRRQVSIGESRVAALQEEKAYTGAEKTSADEALASVRKELAGVSAQLLNANPRYEQVVSSAASLDELQSALKPGEAYLKTLFFSDTGYGLLVTNSVVRPYAIPLGKKQAAAAVSRLREPLEAQDSLRPFDVAEAYDLYTRIVGSESTEISRARHLIYEPDVAMISLPASMFVTDQKSVALMQARAEAGAAMDYRGVSWLGLRADSSLVLSAASFLQSRKFKPSKARSIYIGFGDPALSPKSATAFTSVLRRGSRGGLMTNKVCSSAREALLDLPPLPETTTELATVARDLGANETGSTVVGMPFNDEALRKRTDLNTYRVIYFATHAILPMPDVCLPEPALITSSVGDGSDGLLEASDILELKLDADLVVLSACDTGGAGGADVERTGLRGGGEALGGLSRAMIYAGARGLIVSHWSVDSLATVRLMTGLFESGASTTAEGLQAAQSALQADVKLSHPYYWAPFTIVGDGGRPLPQRVAAASGLAVGGMR